MVALKLDCDAAALAASRLGHILGTDSEEWEVTWIVAHRAGSESSRPNGAGESDSAGTHWQAERY